MPSKAGGCNRDIRLLRLIVPRAGNEMVQEISAQPRNIRLGDIYRRRRCKGYSSEVTPRYYIESNERAGMKRRWREKRKTTRLRCRLRAKFSLALKTRELSRAKTFREFLCAHGRESGRETDNGSSSVATMTGRAPAVPPRSGRAPAEMLVPRLLHIWEPLPSLPSQPARYNGEN